MERSRFITVAIIVLSTVSLLHATNLVSLGIASVLVLIFVAISVHLIALFSSTKPRLQPISPLISFTLLVVVLLFANSQGNLGAAIPSIDSIIALIDDSRNGVIAMRASEIPYQYSSEVFLVTIILSWVIAEIGETLAQRLHSSAPTLIWYILINATLSINDSTAVIVFNSIVICAAAWFFMYAFEIGTESLKSHVIEIPSAAKIKNFSFYAGSFVVLITLSFISVLPLELPSYAPDDIFKFLNNSRTQSELSPLVGMSEQLRNEKTQVLFTANANEVQYWRVAVLNDFDGESWTISSNTEQEPEQIPSNVPVRPLEASIQLENLAAKFLPAFYSTQSVSSEDIDFLESGVLLSNNTDLKSYQITATAPPADLSQGQIAASSEDAPERVEISTLLPVDFDESIIALSRQIVSDKTSIYEQIISLRNFFLDGSFTYDLNVNYASSTNAMQEFLEKRRGFCEQFATTYAAMARSVGIPARVVVGFTPGTLGTNGTFTVTNKEAHSWVEVYLSNFGWLTIDPTPAGPLPGQAPSNIGQTVTATTTTTIPQSSSASTNAPVTSATNPVAQPKKSSTSSQQIIALIAFGLFVIAGGIVFYANRPRKKGNYEAYIISTFKEIGEKVLDVTPPPDLTTTELAARVPERYEEIREFLALLTIASYAPNNGISVETLRESANRARQIKIEKESLAQKESKRPDVHAVTLKD